MCLSTSSAEYFPFTAAASNENAEQSCHQQQPGYGGIIDHYDASSSKSAAYHSRCFTPPCAAEQV